ncbi:hypothetical protein lbkm_1012 [Lachnospiraceae bacterium KM106-2]|nr:hypothetical protein lbkm_1012 [Lachnospiraceae bacterium KM106-2]
MEKEEEYTKVHSRAELIRLARESCIQTYSKKQPKTNYVELEQIFEEKEMPKQPSEPIPKEPIITNMEQEQNEPSLMEMEEQAKVPIFSKEPIEKQPFEVGEFLNEDEIKQAETVSPHTRSFGLRVVVAVLLVIIIIGTDKTKPNNPKITSVKKSITENTTVNQLEEGMTTFAREKILPLFGSSK